MSIFRGNSGHADDFSSSVSDVQYMAQSHQLHREQSEITMTVSHAHSRTPQTTHALPRRMEHLGNPSPRAASKMRDAERAGPPTGWSRNETCEAGSRRRRGHGWTPAPVVTQPLTSPVELDPAEIAGHLTALLAAGWTLPQLEVEVGLDQKQLRSLLAGVVVDPLSAATLVDFGLGCRPHQSLAPSLGSWRRTQALIAMGWSLERQCAELSVDMGTLEDLCHTQLIRGSLWLAIDALYDRWSMTLGPDVQAMEQARAAGVTPPLGWDDDELDHPSARSLAAVDNRRAIVDEAAIARRCGGDNTVAICPGERAEITRIAVDEQWPAARLAVVLDIDEESARRTLRRWRAADREDQTDIEVSSSAGDQQPQEADLAPASSDTLGSLGGPTTTELEALRHERASDLDWVELTGLDLDGSAQLDLGLVVHPRRSIWRRPSKASSCGACGGGGGDPGEYEQLMLEVVAEASAA